MVKSLKWLVVFLTSTVFIPLGQAQTGGQTETLTEAERTAIEARIMPHGRVCLEGDENCGPDAMAAVAMTGASARSGEEVYNAACLACHATGVANAPKLGDAAAWASRLAKGMDTLYEVGLNGLPGTTMIAKGGCMACSDEEVRAAVDYMVDSVR